MHAKKNREQKCNMKQIHAELYVRTAEQTSK